MTAPTTSPDPAGEAFTASPLSRRTALAALASFGAAAVLAACGSDAKSSASTAATTATTAGTTASTTAATTAGTSAASSAATSAASTDSATCVQIPEETAGPFPGDGSNGANVLGDSAIVRKDIRSSYGSSTTTAQGVPLTIQLTLTDTANGCAPMPGAAVYAWHCDAEGRYSLYSSGATGENYLRGVQAADANGVVTFTSIFPAAYPGRWPHIHFEVYPDLASAANVANKVATSQVALPQETCELVYATDMYPNSARNLTQISLQSDNVFGDDGGVHELATMSGSVADGFVSALTVPV